jgi:hypothetical protein
MGVTITTTKRSTSYTGPPVLHCDVLSIVLSYLAWKEVMNCRIVSCAWCDAARHAPFQKLGVNGRDIALALPTISAALPCLHTIVFEGDDFDLGADELFALARGFRNLMSLWVTWTNLEAFHPRIMQLHSLRSLNLHLNRDLAWNLEDVSAFPKLIELCCTTNYNLTGDLSSLQVLSETLVVCSLSGCENVTGDLHMLASFPCLESLKLDRTKVTGDIRKIEATDFSSLTRIRMNTIVYGGRYIDQIANAHETMQGWYLLERRHPGIYRTNGLLELLRDAPGLQEYNLRYNWNYCYPPHYVDMVWYGTRCGWRWTNCRRGGDCDMHWLNDEPLPREDGYEKYIRDLKQENTRYRYYRGFLAPPTLEQLRRMATAQKFRRSKNF